jgi:cytochrome c oxidase cbb3-type subunit 3
MSSEMPEVPVPERPRGDEAPRDGIGEEDNRIPLWFNVAFLGSIVFALVYVPYYLLSGWSSALQYDRQVEVAERHRAEALAQLPEQNPYHGNPAAIAEGKEVYTTICAACHKPDGSGLVGPSLVDPYWKYGHTDHELFETVSGGRPGGMPAWGPVLGTEKIWKVLAYVETLPRSKEPGVGSPEYQARAQGG